MGHYTASMKRVRGIARKREGKMGWTKERPTGEGVFWFRKDGIVTIAEATLDPDDGLQFWTIRDECHLWEDELADGEWQGPIRPEP